MRTSSKVPSKEKSAKTIRVADYIVDFLVKRKIKDIFVLTGFGAMYLNDAIAANKKIKYYCARNEAASPMMAEAYARLKGRCGAVCLTAGPGSTNAVPGLAEAYVDSAPVFIISGQVEKKFTTYLSKIKGLRSLGTAEINIVPIVKTLTKYSIMVTNPKAVRFHLEKAYYLASSGRPGPVWLDVPQDIQSAKINPVELKGFVPKITKSKDLNSKTDKVIGQLIKAKNPLIIAGNGIRQSHSVEQFKVLIEKLKVPIMLTRLGLDILPYSHPQNMGLGGIKGTRFCFEIGKKADFVLVLGARLAISFLGENLDLISKRAKVAAVDIDQSELKKPRLKIDFPIHADVKEFLKNINKKTKNINKKRDVWYDWLKKCQKLKDDYPMINKSMIKNPIDLYYFMSRLDELSPKNSILVTDAGSNYYVGGQIFKFERGQRELTSATFAAMGLSIPLSIGAAISKKNSLVLAVTGDGSLELNIQELKTISYYFLNIKLFVINNNGYVSMRNWQDAYFEGRRIGSDNNTGAEILNLKKVAEAFDLDYEIIKDYKEIDRKLRRIISQPGPLFVEVVCDDKQKIITPKFHYDKN